MLKQTLFFGTNNPHKLAEIRTLLGDTYNILSFEDFPPLEVEETETTLAGNAARKAEAFYTHTGLPCFADDTGLSVTALGGEPGVFSARYAGENCTSKDNIALLLKNLSHKDDRTAKFMTVIAFYNGKEMRIFEGQVFGTITSEVRGAGGFGYDPIFLPDGYPQTFAEMPPETKHSISHRGRAIQAFVEFLVAKNHS